MTDNNSHTASSSSFPPSDWVETTLGEVCEIKSGSTPSTKEESFWNGEISWITPKDLSNYNSVYISKGEKSITQAGLKNSSAQLLPKNTILFSSRAPIGYVAIAQNELTTNQGFKNLVCDEKKSHFKFFYYLLKEKADHIEKLSSGSTFSEASASLMRSIQISLPPLPEQQAIASVLSAFDDKIELLREENKTLEQTGQVIFGEWFGKYGVDDDKMNTEGREGGLGQLPEGWRVFELSEIVDIINGYAYKGSDLVEDSKTALVTLKSFDRNGGFQTRGFKPFIGNPKETQEVKVGDLVVAHTDLTQDAEVLGNPAFIFDDGGFEKMFITMDLVKVISKDENITNAFLYYLMKTKEFKGHCVGYANGTTVLHLSKKAIPEYQIALPNDFGILSDVSLLLKETTDKIADINSQIQTLANTRDEILPKLMSGMLRVNDFSNN
jgi:type I restriction enzyme S subunit